MKADFLYNNAFGRGLLKAIQLCGGFKLAACFVRSRLSKFMIKSFIANNNIDMSPFEGQEYRSFAEFFARKKEDISINAEPDKVISPCDGLLSYYKINENEVLPIKGSGYRICDIIPDNELAKSFSGGLCLIFRLEASDYHHFCYFADCRHIQTKYIPGQLHSVQPIACEKYPVYRLNRRWWTLLETERFGTVAQIEVGAMLVGGVTHAKESGNAVRGEEMGNFELAGSTIILLFSEEAGKKLTLDDRLLPAYNGVSEVPVKMGEVIGW